MKVLIVCQYFYPEEFKVNDLAEELVKKGHKVTVLTGKPNYPIGKIMDGYKISGVMHELYMGAEVIRVPLIPRGNGSGGKLGLNYFSFLLTGSWYTLTHKMDFDKIVCFQLSPLTMIYPAIIAKWKSKAKLSLWVQDLWPESIFAAGKMKVGFAYIMKKILTRMTKKIYKASDIIFIQSPRFSESILAKGDFKEKLIWAPNWAEDQISNTPKAEDLEVKKLIPNGFIVMFAGNIGEAQDFENIIEAAKILKTKKEIKWIIVGDGRKRIVAENLVNKYGLTETVKFLGRHPIIKMPYFFHYADAMLVTLKNEFIFNLTIPSKIQAYMAAGKPLLSMLTGVSNIIIKEARCGYIAESEDVKTLAENVLKIYNLTEEERCLMGKNASEYYNMNFSKKSVIETIVRNW